MAARKKSPNDFRPASVAAVDVGHQYLSGGDDTRARLLQAAIEAIDIGGESAVRIRSVADRAGVTEPSIYHFFGGREGLIEAAQAERFRLNLDDLARRFLSRVVRGRTKQDFVDIIRTTLTESFASDRRVARAHRLSVLGAAQSRPALRAKLAQARQLGQQSLVEALEIAVERGWAPEGLNVDVAARWIAGLVSGRAFIEMDGVVEPEDDAAWNDMAIAAIVHAVVAPDR